MQRGEVMPGYTYVTTSPQHRLEENLKESICTGREVTPYTEVEG
jgi:hypothetical protein